MRRKAGFPWLRQKNWSEGGIDDLIGLILPHIHALNSGTRSGFIHKAWLGHCLAMDRSRAVGGTR